LSASAIAKIRADLERHRRLFDFTQDELGKKLCKAATDGVQECFAGSHSPDGEGWEYLSEKYDAWKEFHYPGQPIGVLHGIMSDPHQVAGELDITPSLARVTYGITEAARDLAVWFQDPEGSNQPPRRFWGLTENSKSASKEILDARFATV
jgi:hypothetical protein